jgi:hypothetical protein
MKPGDLVQSTIFDCNGSGGYGLVVAPYRIPGYWKVQWNSDDWELSSMIVGVHEVHEKDLVVVSTS